MNLEILITMILCTLLVHKTNKVNLSLIISGVLSKKNFSELEENIK